MLPARFGDRSLFPGLEARSYLAHCAISPVSAPVRAAVNAVIDSYARLGVGAIGPWLEQRAALRGQLAALIGAESADIALVANTTTGVVHIAQSLAWRVGDRVVLFDGEFPTNVTPWRQAAAAFGLRLVRLPLAGFGMGGGATGDGLFRLEAALREGVRLVAVSAVQFQTGLAMPLAAMGRLCRQYGAELFVDAIQAVGMLPIDVRAMGIDYLACGSHKWLMGIEGCAFVYVAPERVGALVPRLAGWLSHEDPVGFLFGEAESLSYDREFRARADVFEGGAANAVGLAALGAAVGQIASLGVDRIYAHVLAWHDAIESALVERGFRSLRGTGAARSGILAVRWGALPSDAQTWGTQDLVAALGRRGVVVSAPEGCVRLAPSWPNALDEVLDVLAAFDGAMREARG